MNATVRCPRCRKIVATASATPGGGARCASCGHEFTPETENLGGLSLSDLIRGGPEEKTGSGSEDTVSYSMLARSPLAPLAPVVPPNEMLGRLDPRTLRWLFATDAVLVFLGQSLEQLRKRTFPEFLHPDDRALAEDEFRKAVEVGERHDFILRIKPPSGELRYVRVYTQARYNPDGEINHIRCYLKDVTARIHAEEELRRRTEQLTAANEQLRETNQKLKAAQSQLVATEKLAALGTLAAGMAHEINNPLAFALNNVAVLGRDLRCLLEIIADYQEGEDALRQLRPVLAESIARRREEADLPYIRENLGRMIDATRHGLQRVGKIVENLRGFAQLDRSTIATIDINLALENCLAMIADPLAQQGVTVLRYFETLPPLDCAAAHLNQVFLNLLLNSLQAIEATGRRSGQIRIDTRALDHEIVVEITDNGCGIPADQLPRIFDPFFTTRPVGKGTGLGLSISHGIVAEHGGRIEVASAVGKWSRFRVHLPAGRAPNPPPPPPPRAGGAS